MEGSSFKKGSGSLDFGDDDGSHDPEGDGDATSSADPESDASTTAPSEDRDRHSPDAGTEPARGDSDASPSTGTASEKYPYFVRRNTVGEERDHRLELHVREKVADGESDFRSALADELGVDEVPKTDAREFALLHAYQNVEGVARLMEDEGHSEVN